MYKAIQKNVKFAQIRSLLFVVGSGIVFAFILAGVMLYIYNPSGVYMAQHLLLSPEYLKEDALPVERRGKAYAGSAWESAEFSWYDERDKRWMAQEVHLRDYEQLYTLINKDSSLLSFPEEIEKLFNIQHPFTLSVILKVKHKKQHELLKNFLVMQFAENEDYYRIQLRVQGQGEQRAYFYHRGDPAGTFSKKLLNIFLNR